MLRNEASGWEKRDATSAELRIGVSVLSRISTTTLQEYVQVVSENGWWESGARSDDEFCGEEGFEDTEQRDFGSVPRQANFFESFPSLCMPSSVNPFSDSK